MTTAPDATRPLSFVGQIHVVLTYRLAPPNEGDARPGDLHLSDAACAELAASLTSAGERGQLPCWALDPGVVLAEVLLPHLSELLPETADTESGASHAAEATPIGTYSLQLPNVPDWSKRGRSVSFGGMDFVVPRRPSLYVFGTGIAYLVWTLDLPSSDASDCDAAQLQRALRQLVRGYGGEKHARSGFSLVDAPTNRPTDARPSGKPSQDRLGWAKVHDVLGMRRGAAPAEPGTTDAWHLGATHWIRPFLPSGWSVRAPWVQRVAARGDRRRTAPLVVGLVGASRALTPSEREGWRELLDPKASLDLAGAREPGLLRPSKHECCLVGRSVVLWVAEPGARKPDVGTLERFRQSHLFLCILAEHQRTFLVSLTTAVSEMRFGHDAPASQSAERAIDLRESLIRYGARYHFATVCVEGRHERFYLGLSRFFRVEELFVEAEREVHGVHELAELAAARTRTATDGRRNVVLGMLAVCSPLQVVLAAYQIYLAVTGAAAGLAFVGVLGMTSIAMALFMRRLVPEDFDAFSRMLQGPGTHAARFDSGLSVRPRPTGRPPGVTPAASAGAFAPKGAPPGDAE
jgi:hypothetical protein